ncbi:MAG: hypothetical protein ONB44_04005 [candidate division KSB1 bacterium]|nr:hypothetical protein [candidate division KSB1 bacterium]MDZ7301294.1 hypothetical protein [candidate division KSB1 bacterium]MDZ7310821.1 hypothetical protein [candidate division KSB1 bacterium]
MKKKRRKKWMLHKSTSAPPESQPQAVQSLLASLKNRDELTLITGITPVTEMALNRIGIYKFCELAACTPQSLARELQAQAGMNVPDTVIASQDWIGSAELLAREPISSNTVAIACEPAENTSVAHDLSVASLPISNVSEEPVQTIAGTVHEDASEYVAPETRSTEAKRQLEKSTTGLGSDGLNLQIRSARFEQFATSETPAENLLRGEINCELIGSETQLQAVASAMLCTQIHTIDMSTGDCELLAFKTEGLQPDQTTYCLQLVFNVPKVGCYQLQAVAFLLADDSRIALYRGPVLRVV